MFGMMHAFPTAQQQLPRRASSDGRLQGNACIMPNMDGRLQREPRTLTTPPCDEGRAALRDSAAERVAIATALAPSPARERPLASSSSGGGGASDGTGADRVVERADRVATWQNIPVLVTPRSKEKKGYFTYAEI